MVLLSGKIFKVLKNKDLTKQEALLIHGLTLHVGNTEDAFIEALAYSDDAAKPRSRVDEISLDNHYLFSVSIRDKLTKY